MDIRFPPATSSLTTGKLVNTIYQNGSRTRLVFVTVELNTGADGSSAPYAQLTVGATSPPVTVVAACGIGFPGGGTPGLTVQVNQLTGIIPPNYYYELTTLDVNFLTGTVTALYAWDELDITG
jgi:hypothetical protein